MPVAPTDRGPRKQDYETPDDLYETYNQKHHFRLDAAAQSHNTKCKVFFSPEDDAIKQDWVGKGPFWLNPPWDNIKPFIAKALEAQELGETGTILLPMRTDQPWYQEGLLPRIEKGQIVETKVKGRVTFKGQKTGVREPVGIFELLPLGEAAGNSDRVRRLGCTLAAPELLACGKLLSERMKEGDDLRAEAKVKASEFKSRIETIQKQINELGEARRTGVEYRDVPVEWGPIGHEMVLRRTDTDEIIEKRLATDEERQLTIEDAKANGETKEKKGSPKK